MPKKSAKQEGAAPKGDHDFKEQLREINEILAWFDAQEELDIETALEKIRKASELVRASKKRLAAMENEFEEIKKEEEGEEG